MKAQSPHKQLDSFIAKYTPEIAARARAALTRLRRLVPGATLLVYDNYNALAIGFGPNERASDAILSLALFPRWVSLFFLQGAGLPDPDGLLRGSDKKARHLVLPDARALDAPAVRALIATALHHARVPIDLTTKSRIVIKSVSQTQRARRPASKAKRPATGSARDRGKSRATQPARPRGSPSTSTTPTTRLPTYVIDLDQDEEDRWNEVIACDQAAALQIVREASAEFDRVPEFVRRMFARLYQVFGGLYRGEIRAWANALGVSVGTATVLNCAYELSHLRIPKPLGCTAGVGWIEGLGLMHLRTLDWPLPGMGAATRLFRFRRGEREFIAVGVPGQVSVLSGMRPGAYSITINWAPPGAMPSFEFGPAFLVRHTLESCDSYAKAVQMLRRTPLSTSVFFTVCGTEPRQACVIERTQRAAAVRELTATALTQANHHVAARFARNNRVLREVEGEGFHEDSNQRAETLCRALTDAGPALSLEASLAALNTPPVCNQYTVQQMAFCPRTGDAWVWPRSGAKK
jgi:hypothetical protein